MVTPHSGCTPAPHMGLRASPLPPASYPVLFSTQQCRALDSSTPPECHPIS